jgi:hypothetical protein
MGAFAHGDVQPDAEMTHRLNFVARAQKAPHSSGARSLIRRNGRARSLVLVKAPMSHAAFEFRASPSGVELMHIKNTIRTAIAAGLLSLGFAAVPAKADVALGMLTCHAPESMAYLVISQHQYRCVYQPVAGAPQYYNARISRFGAEIGTSSNTTLAWAVLAVTRPAGPAQLAGFYGGASAGGAFLVGARANGLVGGLPNAFTLQPVSLEGEAGFNVVATVSGLELMPVEPGVRPRVYRHHRRG